MFSTLSLITFAFIAIVVFAFVWPLNFSRRTKIVLSVIVCLLPCKSYISLIVGGTPFDPEIPFNLTFITDLGRSTLIFLALLVIIRSVLNGITKLVKWSKQASLIPAQSPFYALIVFVFAFAFAAYGTSCGYGSPKLQKYDITFEKLDPRFDGLKIIHLADIHVSAPTDVKMIYDMVNDINALEPDLVLIPGDIIDGAIEDRKPIIDLLFDLKAKYGVFISTGNHEYYSGYTPWRKYFEKNGFISLDNKVVALTDDQGKTLLNLGGITDSVAQRFNLPLPDIKGVAAAIDAQAPSIVLSHRPQFATDLSNTKKVDLILSGHTHGGLVIGLDRIVAKANGGFVSGLYNLANNSTLIVSNGTMIWMGFPLRIGVPSQINVITLHSKVKPNSQTFSLTRKGELQRIKEEQAQDILHLENNQNHEQQADDSTALNNTQSSNQTDATATSPVKDSQNKPVTADSQLANVQLILKMKNARNGEVQDNITNIAVLPENLTADQLTRIQAIINEDPISRQKAMQQLEAKHKAVQVPSVHLKVIKDSTSKQEPNAAASNASAPAPVEGAAQAKPAEADSSNSQSSKGDQPQTKEQPAQNQSGSNNQSNKTAAAQTTASFVTMPQTQNLEAPTSELGSPSLISFGESNTPKAVTHQIQGTTTQEINFSLVPPEVPNHLNAFLDSKPHDEDDLVTPFNAEIKYSPQYGSDMEGPSAFDDNLSLELQVIYSLSLDQEGSVKAQKQKYIKNLLQ